MIIFYIKQDLHYQLDFCKFTDNKIKITNMAVSLISLFLTLSSVRVAHAQIDTYGINLETAADCKSGDSDVFHEYYDIASMQCTPCSQNSTIQTISEDGFSCVCTETYRIVSFLGNPGQLTCDKCPSGQVAALDGWNCVTCSTSAPSGNECPTCSLEDELEADRDLTGEWLLDAQNDTTVTCVTCLNDTLPDDQGTRCVRCNEQLAVQPDVGCICPPERLSGGLCFGSVDDLVREDILDYTVTYETGENDDIEIVSSYIKDNLRTVHASCTNFTTLDPATRVDYSNLTSCQALANLCVMTLYSQPSANSLSNPCSLFMGLAAGGGAGFPEHEDGIWTVENSLQSWKANMPFLYYIHDLDDPADDVLIDESITQVYTTNDRLKLMTASYSLTGDYLGTRDLTDNDLIMCGDGTRIVDQAFKFGTGYSKECEVSVDRLFDATDVPLVFHDLFLQFQGANSQTRMQAVPILLLNYTLDGEKPNMENLQEDWQLMRRYFVLDQITGVEENSNSPTVIRFLEKFKLIITQQPNIRNGLIYPPYAEMTYSYVLEEQYGTGESVKVKFSVEYQTDLERTNRDINIAIGIMGALAVALSILQTTYWNKREGKISIDCVSILRAVMFLAANLANAFFVTILGFSLWLFIVYKAQGVVYLVPDPGTEYQIKAFIGSAFGLKILHLIQVLVTQCRVDIFFIDWEKPKRPIHDQTNRPLPPRSETESYMNEETGSPVSIWRSYLVANEWVELMTSRKVRPFWQLFLVLVVLHVAGVENLARVDTDSRVQYFAYEQPPEYHLVFRFALGASVYIGIAILQWLFNNFFWVPCINDPVMNFVDLCSMSNVSVFAISHEQYGYYIHGRSVHGTADVGLEEMYTNLSREEEGMCSRRGLMAGDDVQTFEMFIPKKLRTEYNRILFSVYRQRRQAASRRTTSTEGGTKLDPETDKRLDAYLVINKFMQNYIDHNLESVDYVVAEKNLWERIMDTEMVDDFDTGYFFTDSAHRFDRLLFYGQESVLIMAEVLMFEIVDIAGGGYVLAAIITYIFIQLIHTIRHHVGKKNVASKTMTDARFLI